MLEPGGRIAVNVANLGRRPYRSLSGDVTEILQDLGLLLRGEVVWWKGRAAGGSCAWGSFQRPANPVLRDVTERVVIASKGRFDRALTPAQRQRSGSAVHGHHLPRRVHGGHDRPVGDPARERHPGRPPGTVPGRAPEAAHRALHLRGRRRARPVHGLGQRPRWPRCAPVATTSASTPTPTTSTIAEARIAEERDRLAALQHGVTTPFRVRAAGRPAGGRLARTSRREPYERAGRRKELAEVLLAACGFRDIRRRRQAARPGHRAQLRRQRPDRRGLGVRRVRRVHLEPRRTQPNRHALEVARQGGGAPRERVRAEPSTDATRVPHHRRAPRREPLVINPSG